MEGKKLEKIFAPYAERDKILQEFEYEKRYIEEITGLTLNTFEGVGLRKITEDVMRRMVKEGIEGVNGNTMVDLCEEIPTRFLQEFFDIDLVTFRGLPRDESFNFDEATKEWFRREQEKRLLI